MKKKYDVIVCGSGPAGINSALYAHKNGADVLLLEKNSFLGGMSTSGLINVWCGTASSQLFEDIKQKLSVKKENRLIYEPEELNDYYRKILKDTEIDVLLHSFVHDVEKEKDKIKKVIVTAKNGPFEFESELFIDATGDGDVAKYAGVPYTKGRKSDGKMQPATLMVRIGGINENDPDFLGYDDPPERYQKLMKEKVEKGNIPFPAGHIKHIPCKQKGSAILNMTNIIEIDGTKAEDLTEAEFLCRSQIFPIINFLRENLPGFEDCYIIQSACHVGIRETRHFEGLKCLDKDDISAGRNFDDWAVSRAFYGFGVHSLSGEGCSDKSTRGMKSKQYTIPYGCFLPINIENLMLAGRCISGTHLAHSSFRVMPICMAMGQAVGTAAALSIKKHINPKELNVKKLQQTLLSQGVKSPYTD